MSGKFIPLLCLLLASSGFSAQAAAGWESLKFLSVVYPSRVGVGQTAVVTVTLIHEKTSIPTITLYYVYFINQTVLTGGWRASQVRLNWTDGEGISIYRAEIPNPAYAETIPYNSKVIFYLEARDPLGGTLLTCGDASRWNPYVEHDKYIIQVVDETPPSIPEVEATPADPTELDPVLVTVRALDDASGVDRVELTYWVEGVGRVEAMNATHRGVYAAKIPSQPSGTKVVYSVAAVDRAGNEGSIDPRSYTVGVSPSIQIQRAKRVLTYLASAAAAILAGLAACLWRRGWRPPRTGCEHPKAMTLLMLLSILAAGSIYYQLAQLGSPLIGLLITAAAVLSWIILDPRIVPLIPNKLRLDRYPPLTLVAEGLIIAFAGALLTAVSASLGLHSLAHAYTLAVIIGKYVIGLMAAGLVLQALWPQLKDIKFFLEVEELEG